MPAAQHISAALYYAVLGRHPFKIDGDMLSFPDPLADWEMHAIIKGLPEGIVRVVAGGKDCLMKGRET